MCWLFLKIRTPSFHYDTISNNRLKMNNRGSWKNRDDAKKKIPFADHCEYFRICFLFFHSGKVFENNLQELICSLQTFYSMHHDSLKGISQCHVSDPYNPPKVWFQSRSWKLQLFPYIFWKLERSIYFFFHSLLLVFP